MNPEELVGTDYGCMHIEDSKLVRSKGRTKTLLYGYCLNCGNPMCKSIADLNAHKPKYCKNCPTPYRVSHKDLSGADYPAFRVLRRLGEYLGGNTIWLCICKVCGKECEIEQRRLNKYKSCGCLRDKGSKVGREYRMNELNYGGTNISMISPDRRLNKNSTTGHRGVSRMSDGQYRAYITYRWRQINLGVYRNLADAVAARKRGEEKYFAPILEEFEESGGKIIGKYSKKIPNRYKTQNIIVKNDKYYVCFEFHGKQISLGAFPTLEDAIAARDKARAERGMKPVE